ncbi:MAG: hypothetical protein AB1611_03610 [bacterium]
MRLKIPGVVLYLCLTMSTAWCSTEPGIKITVSHDLISFHFISGQTGMIEPDISAVRVVLQSGTGGWVFSYLAGIVTGPSGNIMPDRLLMKTPYTNGFESLELPRLVGKGDGGEPPPLDVAAIQFRYMATGHEKPGVYEGNIYSVDMDMTIPTIHVRLIIDAPVPGAEFAPSSKMEEVTKETMVNVTLSSQEIHFSGMRSRKECDADSTILLTVKSKDGFIVKAHATSLVGKYSNISADRLSVNPGNGNYYSLESDVVILEQPSGHQPDNKEKTVTTELSFRLKTGLQDAAGDYRGEIVITCIPEL